MITKLTAALNISSPFFKHSPACIYTQMPTREKESVCVHSEIVLSRDLHISGVPNSAIYRMK